VKLEEKVYLKTVNTGDQLQHLIEVAAIMQYMLEFSSVPEILCVTGHSYVFRLRLVTFSSIVNIKMLLY
jgi:hypothetical protein